jgi:hypothetical protein
VKGFGYAALFRWAAAGDACARLLADHSSGLVFAGDRLITHSIRNYFYWAAVMGSGQIILPAVRGA